MSGKQDHPFHLVNPSPWPILASFSALLMPVGGVLWMHQKHIGKYLFIAGLLSVIFIAYRWWRDVVNEAAVDHAHTEEVRTGLRMGMAGFITSEVMFFFAFFLAYFSVAIWPLDIVADLWNNKAAAWPPVGVKTFEAFDLPFLNTLILLLSGTTVTWAHHALLEKNQKELVMGLGLTVLLGMSFTTLQAIEYHHAPFAFKDGVYPSLFFMLTGFHGLHVIIGTIFLAVCWVRARRGQFSEKHHLGFEFAAWYWHFVDVVWLFLFVFVYWWGGAKVIAE